MNQTIPGSTSHTTVDGTQQIIKLKTMLATFSLRPVKGEEETYRVQVTCKDLPGLFKNSGPSGFGPFLVTRHPGRNAVQRPKDLKPLTGNAVLMWPSLNPIERSRCLEYIEKLLRVDLPRLVLEELKQAA